MSKIMNLLCLQKKNLTQKLFVYNGNYLSKIYKYNALCKQYHSSTGTDAPSLYLMSELHVSKQGLEKLKDYASLEIVSSLNSPIKDTEDSSITLLDSIQDDVDIESDSIEKVYQSELSETMEEALSYLPDKESEILISRFYDNLTYKEIGAEKGITVEGVRKNINRGLHHLKNSPIESKLHSFYDEYSHTIWQGGIGSFRRSESSSVERSVI